MEALGTSRRGPAFARGKGKCGRQEEKKKQGKQVGKTSFKEGMEPEPTRALQTKVATAKGALRFRLDRA